MINSAKLKPNEAECVPLCLLSGLSSSLMWERRVTANDYFAVSALMVLMKPCRAVEQLQPRSNHRGETLIHRRHLGEMILPSHRSFLIPLSSVHPHWNTHTHTCMSPWRWTVREGLHGHSAEAWLLSYIFIPFLAPIRHVWLSAASLSRFSPPTSGS